MSCDVLLYLCQTHSACTSHGKVGELGCEVVVLFRLELVELEVLLLYVLLVMVLVVVVRLLEFRLVDL